MPVYSETTDAPSNPSTPYAITAGDDFHGTLSAGEADWIALDFDYDAGLTYLVRLSPGSLSDPLLGVYTASGAYLGGNDNSGPGAAAFLPIDPTGSGRGYLSVQGASAADAGSYVLSIQGDPSGDIRSHERMEVGTPYDGVLNGTMTWTGSASTWRPIPRM